jgi:uncharacterized protein YjbI with pentapeptide repeats
LNIELFLVSFFVIAPLIFVTLHVYVLVQILMLARTSETYEQALPRRITTVSAQQRFRHRLPNTLFAQIFAGAATEREGLVGMILKLMAWSTLIIAPTFVLLTVQIKFLPYHSPLVTWFHRGLTIVDLGATLILWRASTRLHEEVNWKLLSRNWIADILAVSVGYFSVVLASFPGEFQANLEKRVQRLVLRALPNVLRLDTSHPTECDANNMMTSIFSMSFDRLVLENLHATDDQTVASIDRDARIKDQSPYEGQRARNFRDRDLRCASFRGLDLRRADFTNANLSGADLTHSDLQGTQFFRANLSGAVLDRTRLQSASLQQATLLGTSLRNSRLQGAYATGADLRGASLANSRIQGADLSGSTLDGADFSNAFMQVTNLTGASLRAASLRGAALQGAKFDAADLGVADFSEANLWRANPGNCGEAHFFQPVFDAVLPLNIQPKPSESIGIRAPSADAATLTRFIEESVVDVPEIARAEVSERLRLGLAQSRQVGEAERQAELWNACKDDTTQRKISYPDRAAVGLVRLVCIPTPEPRNPVDLRHLIEGLFRNRIDLTFPGTPASQAFAKQLFDWISSDYCVSARVLSRATRETLRTIRDGRLPSDPLPTPSPVPRLSPWVERMLKELGMAN